MNEFVQNPERSYHLAQLQKGNVSNDRLKLLAECISLIHHHGVYGAIPARKRRDLKEGQLIAMGALALAAFRNATFFEGLDLERPATAECALECPHRSTAQKFEAHGDTTGGSGTSEMHS